MEYRCNACKSTPCIFNNGKKNHILGRPTRCPYGSYVKTKWEILFEGKPKKNK